MKKNFDIAIIGGGIIGAACARRLAREGLRLILIESKEIAGGTTAAGMGHLVVMDDSEAQFALTRYSLKLWRSTAEEFPIRAEYENCGTIWVAADSEEMAEVGRKFEFYKQRGVKAEILDEKAVSEAEPNLRKGLAGGLLVPGDSVVYQLSAARFFWEEAARFGAELATGKSVVKIADDSLTLNDGTKISADRVILAAGFQTNELVPGLKIAKRKGQLVITESYPGFVGHQLVELGYLKSAHSEDSDSVAFNVQPRITGQVLIGSSRSFGCDDSGVDFPMLGRMLRRAFEYLPELKKMAGLRVWTGFRPATPDNLPVIGRHPLFPKLFLAAGHEGLGITTSLGTAEILTDEILERDSAIPREPYSPARFELTES
ncbi:MAG: FAD-dependent oxidoreductase [Pyrinomonadaceae bacterium]